MLRFGTNLCGTDWAFGCLLLRRLPLEVVAGVGWTCRRAPGQVCLVQQRWMTGHHVAGSTCSARGTAAAKAVGSTRGAGGTVATCSERQGDDHCHWMTMTQASCTWLFARHLSMIAWSPGWLSKGLRSSDREVRSSESCRHQAMDGHVQELSGDCRAAVHKFSAG